MHIIPSPNYDIYFIVLNFFYGQVFLVYCYFREKNLVELHKVIVFRTLLRDNRFTHIHDMI